MYSDPACYEIKSGVETNRCFVAVFGGSNNKQKSQKKPGFLLFNDLLSLKADVKIYLQKVTSKNNLRKKEYIFVGILKVTDEKSRRRNRLAVRRARVRIPTRHPREVSATELFSEDGMERASANVYGCKSVWMYCMYEISRIRNTASWAEIQIGALPRHLAKNLIPRRTKTLLWSTWSCPQVLPCQPGTGVWAAATEPSPNKQEALQNVS